MRKFLVSTLSIIALAAFAPKTVAVEGEQININLGYLPEISSPYAEDDVSWNKLATWGVTSPVPLYNAQNGTTAITWETRQKFTGHSTADGLSDSIYGYPDRVIQTNFYLLGSDVAQVVISGLDVNKAYEFTLYGSIRAVAATRGMSITINGAGAALTETLTLKGTTSKPDEAESIFRNVQPKEDGTVTIDFKVADGFDRGVISAMTIYSIPEGSSVALAFSGSIGFFLLRKLF